MRNAAQVAVFDVLARKKTRAVLDACWQSRGPGPPAHALRRELGAGTEQAIKRLVDLQLVDADPGCAVRSPYLWKIVSAVRRLPAGDQFFDIARNPARCALLEKLIAGPVKRDGLHNTVGRTSAWASQTLDALRKLQLLRSERNEQTVRLEDREQVLWIFLLVDQLLMDVHAAAYQRNLRKRGNHHKLADWEPEDDHPIPQRHVTGRAWHPAATQIEAEHVDHPVGTYEALISDQLHELVTDGFVDSASLAGTYPATKVQLDVLDTETSQTHTITTDIWSRRFGLGTEDLRSPPPHLPQPHLIASRVLDWATESAV
jgi:hypothetical protein